MYIYTQVREFRGSSKQRKKGDSKQRTKETEKESARVARER